MPRSWILFAMLLTLVGCVQPPKSEDEVLLGIRQLTTGFGRVGEGYFSADGNWVIFHATPPGEDLLQVYVARTIKQKDNIVGLTRPIRISPSGSSNSSGCFSPDGNTLLFSSNTNPRAVDQAGSNAATARAASHWNIDSGMEIYRVDGWQAAIAAADPQRGVNLAQHKLTDNDFYDAQASFSPDAKHVAFTSNRDGDLDVYVMRPDGTNVIRITNKRGYDGGAVFSPDGRYLLYRSDRKGDKAAQLFVSKLRFDNAGNIIGVERETQLTSDRHLNWHPFFHPPTTSVIYATTALGRDNLELFMQRLDGSKRCRITFEPGTDTFPVFTRDGRYLMWNSSRTTDNTKQLFIARFQYPRYLRNP